MRPLNVRKCNVDVNSNDEISCIFRLFAKISNAQRSRNGFNRYLRSLWLREEKRRDLNKSANLMV